MNQDKVLTNESLIRIRFYFLLLVFCSTTTIAFSSNIQSSFEQLSRLQHINLCNEESLALRYSDPELALENIDFAIELSNSIKDQKQFVNLLLTKIKILNLDYGNEDILDLIDSTFQIYNDLNDTIGIANLYTEGGKLFVRIGDIVRAQDYLERAEVLAESKNDTLLLIKTNLAFGNLYFQVENYKVSSSHYKIALNYAEQVKDTIHIIGAINNIAVNQTDTKEYDLAIESFERILMMKYTDQYKDGIALINLAYIYYLKEDFNKAIDYGQQAQIAIKEYTNKLDFEANLGYTLAKSYIKIGDFEKAKHYSDKICAVFAQINTNRAEFNCYYVAMEVNEALGNLNLALENSQKYIALQEETYGPDVLAQISNRKSKLDLDLKNEEISTLQQLSEANAKLYKRKVNGILLATLCLIAILTSLTTAYRIKGRERKVLQDHKIIESKLSVMQSQMNPHFIFNAFSSVQKFIMTSEKLEANKYLNKLASLLRNIVTNANDIYIYLDKELHLLQNYLELEELRFKERISYELIIDPELELLNPLIPCMMIQPHIENAIIHGLSNVENGGKLLIKIEQYKRGIKCAISDNGIGREAAARLSSLKPEKHLHIASINSQKRLAFLKEIGYDQAEIKIIDLKSAGKALGTEVHIYLPFITRTV